MIVSDARLASLVAKPMQIIGRKAMKTVAIPPVISAIRGGAGKAIVDLDRSLVRLDAVGAYPIVAALLMSAMLDMNYDTPKVIQKIPSDADRSTANWIKFQNAVTCLFSLINIVCIAAAAYSVVVFTLIFIYSKTALGMDLDGAFVTFWAATASHRGSAFNAFFCSMMGFVFSLSLSRFLKETGIIRWIESIPPLVVSVIGIARLKFIMDLAASLIFSDS